MHACLLASMVALLVRPAVKVQLSCCSAQRRVQQVGGAALLDGRQDWEAVVVKALPYGDAALQELRNLLLMRSHALKSSHLTELLDCYIKPMPGPGDCTFVFIITRSPPALHFCACSSDHSHNFQQPLPLVSPSCPFLPSLMLSLLTGNVADGPSAYTCMRVLCLH